NLQERVLRMIAQELQGKEILAQNLKAYRIMFKISQLEMAQRVHMSYRGYGKLERQEVAACLDTVDKVADYLGLTPAMLLCPGMVCLLSDVDPEKYPKPKIKEQKIKKDKTDKGKAKKEKTSKKRKQAKNAEIVEETALPAEAYIDSFEAQWVNEDVVLSAPFEDTTEDIYEETIHEDLYSSDDAEWLENDVNSEEYTDNTEE
ncbi:MAG: helix-turn-helix transcriptional regulator, partial [Peptococcaceae bacterium]|nr:helix-turn-helix transcriptional regulator [Peptococcaceae bacterium]